VSIDVDSGRVSGRVYALVTAFAADPQAEHDPMAELYWEALADQKGRIKPELVRRNGKLVLAGEYADTPKHLLSRKAKDGVDCIAQYIRRRGFEDTTTSDVLAFFAENPTRPKAIATDWRLQRALAAIGVSVTRKQAGTLLEQAERCYLKAMSRTTEQERTKKQRQREKARAEGKCIICTIRLADAPLVTCHVCREKVADHRRARKLVAQPT
jgi:hypothetical protein